MRITDIFLSFPGLILALAFVAALGRRASTTPIIAIALTVLAADRAAGAGRDADAAASRLHRGGPKLQGASSLRDHPAAHRADVPALGASCA